MPTQTASREESLLPLHRFCEFSDGSSVDCETGTCDEGSKSIYVRVRAWKTYETLLPYPGIPNSVAMVRDAYMQAGTR